MFVEILSVEVLCLILFQSYFMILDSISFCKTQQIAASWSILFTEVHYKFHRVENYLQ